MKLYTIGFTKTTAEHFFERLTTAGVKKVIDTRLNRDGQLAGFAKAQDLEFFLKRLAAIEYVAEPMLAPTAENLKNYRDKNMSWDEYANAYFELLRKRSVENTISINSLNNACLLCSEPTADRCHRRLAAEYLRSTYVGASSLEVVHL